MLNLFAAIVCGIGGGIDLATGNYGWAAAQIVVSMGNAWIWIANKNG